MLVRFCLILPITLASISVACGADDLKALEAGFNEQIKPFLRNNCERCHNAEKLTSGVRVDHLDATLEDRHLKLWEEILREINAETMPPEGEKQPTKEARKRVSEWIAKSIQVARTRPVPKNGSARRLTVAQYKNTVRELLKLDEDIAGILPPDAVSKDGFLNNQSTLQLSPLLVESYLEIAEKALAQTIVDPKSKPVVQNFRMDFGASINPNPLKDNLILGADSHLLKTSDFTVGELRPAKSFAYEPFQMRTKYRFIEGYQGNDTVRGWRDYDSIYHSVFACMRGSNGYPKGNAYDLVPNGLLLRPAIPSAEIFGVDSTYGPKANFKIALRELPTQGRFRVTVNAAKYEDGLLLESGNTQVPSGNAKSIVSSDRDKNPKIRIPESGIYQIDIFPPDVAGAKIAIDGSRLEKELIASWSFNDDSNKQTETKKIDGAFAGDARIVSTPFGKGLYLNGNGSYVVKRHESMNVNEGDFTVSAWINPSELRQAGIVSLGKYSWSHGWLLDMSDSTGRLRLETSDSKNQSNGSIVSPPGTIKKNTWQHVAAVVRRGGESKLFVNGEEVAKGSIKPTNLDNPKQNLHIGRVEASAQFKGMIDEVWIHRRALDISELNALIEPGRHLIVKAPAQPVEVMLSLGERQFTGMLRQPAFMAVRLVQGDLAIKLQSKGKDYLGKIVLTPLQDSDPVAASFIAFEKRPPLLGVHMGFRRDCGSTLAPVGSPVPVEGSNVTRFVFDGAIKNYPNPDTEKDNVNYLAGIREIGVRSEFTDGKDRPRLLIKSVEFEGPFYETWPPAGHREIFVEFNKKEDHSAYARHIIRNFATRAFRRPITTQEENSLFAVYEKSMSAGAKFSDSIRDVAQVVLTSPQFLFIIENSPSPKAEPLDSFELASKLSYFLWNSPPDSSLYKLAERGELNERLDGEISRMIDDPRFERFVQEFVEQWLALEKFQVLEPDRKLFPKLTRDTRSQLKIEPIRFVEYLLKNNLSVKNLIQSDFVMANEVTAEYYGLSAFSGNGFKFIPVKASRPKSGGVLTQAAILAGLSDGRESNPIKRGAWVARRIVAEPPDDPPPNVPALKQEKTNLTLRQRLEAHRSQKGCAQCHSKIDPWGVPFEEFDAAGKAKFGKIDSKSALPDKTEVKNFEDLRRYLTVDRIDQVAFSFMKHLATYAVGRNLTYQELEYLKSEGRRQLKGKEYRVQDMVRFVVKSPIFLEK